MFINYSPQSGVSVSTSRNAEAYAGDLDDLIKAVIAGNEAVTCTADGAKDALEDGEYLESLGIADQDALQSAVEEIHAALSDESIELAGQADE